METESNDLTYLDEKIDFNGTKENIITLKCQDCTNFIPESRLSEECILCLLNVVKKYKNLNSSIIRLDKSKELHVSNNIKYLKTYFLNQNKLNKIESLLYNFNFVLQSMNKEKVGKIEHFVNTEFDRIMKESAESAAKVKDGENLIEEFKNWKSKESPKPCDNSSCNCTEQKE